MCGEGILVPPYGTTPIAVTTNEDKETGSFIFETV